MRSKEFINPKLPGKGTGQQSPIGSTPKKGKTPKENVEELVKQAK